MRRILMYNTKYVYVVSVDIYLFMVRNVLYCCSTIVVWLVMKSGSTFKSEHGVILTWTSLSSLALILNVGQCNI